MSTVCSECGNQIEAYMKFCPNCGCEVIVKSDLSEVVGGLKTRFKLFGDKAKGVTQKAGGVSQERATEAIKNMLNLLIQVARNIRKDVPPDMINAIDLNAEVSFIAFSMGVTIDLEQVREAK